MISAAELHTLVTLLATLSFTSTSLSEMHVGKAAVHMAAGELYRRVRVFQSAARKHFAFQCTKFLKTNLHSHICACYKKGKKAQNYCRETVCPLMCLLYINHPMTCPHMPEMEYRSYLSFICRLSVFAGTIRLFIFVIKVKLVAQREVGQRACMW